MLWQKMRKIPWIYMRFSFFVCCLLLFKVAHAVTPDIKQVSADPGAVDVKTGSGALQDSIDAKLGIEDNHGIYFGGLWVADTNALLAGGVPDAKKWTSDNLFILDATADLQKLINWRDGKIGAEFLQFNSQDPNGQAGSIQGYNGLPGMQPLNRSELYQLWYNQKLFDHKLSIRVGKVVPTADFNNVSKPFYLNDSQLEAASTSGLIYTPLFINPTTMGVMPGYYNSAYGVTVKIKPVKNWYLSLGGYDGSLAEGVQTGTEVWPSFDNSYFYIAETGTKWLLSDNAYPGSIGVGAWQQTGSITSDSPELSENGALGTYLFGAQRLWYHSPGIDSSGISGFYQYGISNSDVLPMNRYIGGGLTALGLIPHRINDSVGAGVAYSWLNQSIFDRETELMFQGYYQALLMKNIYLEPALSFIPAPGASTTIPATWTGTLRLIVLF